MSPDRRQGKESKAPEVLQRQSGRPLLGPLLPEKTRSGLAHLSKMQLTQWQPFEEEEKAGKL